MLSLPQKLASAWSRRLWTRVTQLLALSATLLSVSNAWANAPMCDAQGQTIEAPLPLIAQHDGEINAVKDCSPFEHTVIAGTPLPERTTAVVDLPPRVLPIAWRLPPLPVTARARLANASVGGSRPGYARGVFHPPCEH